LLLELCIFFFVHCSSFLAFLAFIAFGGATTFAAFILAFIAFIAMAPSAKTLDTPSADGLPPLDQYQGAE